jgi:L-iditol 2-dehydrogenase
MKALVKHSVGPGGVQLMEMPEPELRPGHVIVEVEAAGICGTDLHIQDDEYPSNPPVILGHEFSGTVVEVASDVSASLVGRRITSLSFFSTCDVCEACRLGQWNLCPERKSMGSGTHGAFARYVLVPQRSVRLLPDNVDFIAGALTEPLACITHALLNRPTIRPGEVVVVLGPGAIGQLAAQVAAAYGATVVVVGTGADRTRLEMAKALGAHYTVNLQEQSPVSLVEELTRGLGADVVAECSGAAAGLRLAFDLIKRGGQLAQIGLFGKSIEFDIDRSILKEVTTFTSFASTWKSWDHAVRLMAKGLVQTGPLVTEALPLDRWQEGFDRSRAKDGVKFVLLPKQ